MTRTVIAFVTGLVCVFQLIVVGLGYLDHGTYLPLATYSAIDPYHERVVSLTDAGAAAGLRVGDTIDRRELSLPQRVAMFWAYWKAGTVFPTPVHRGDAVVVIDQPVVPTEVRWSFAIDMLSRLIVFVVGILLIARGGGRPALWAGLALVGIGLQQGYALSWGSVPVAIGIAGFAIQSVAFIPSYYARFAFAACYIPETDRRTLRIFQILFAVAFAALLIGLILRRVEVFAGFAVIGSNNLWQSSQLVLNLLIVPMFGIAAARATGPSAASVRVVFWSYTIGIAIVSTNTLLGALGVAPPWNGVLNLGYEIFAIGFAYAVFAKGLVSVNFYVSKAAIYTLVVVVIVAVFVVFERLIEVAALGKLQSQVLELAVPLALGLSARWIEGYAERIVERALYREKLFAEEALEALIRDFPYTRGVSTLESAVVSDIHKLMHAPSVALYRESRLGFAPVASAGGKHHAVVSADDRAFVRMRATQSAVDPDALGSELHAVLALPLVVVGKITGAIVVTARANGERYDPDEVRTLSKLAHELAITLLWAEREPLSAPQGTRA